MASRTSNDRDPNSEKNADLQKCIKMAWEEWQNAIRMFNEVTDKEEIDYVIFKLNSCEKKYMNLLRQAQEENLNHNPYLK